MMKIDPDLLAKFAIKSKSKKMSFSIHRARRQVSMLIDDENEGRELQKVIGGTVGRKVRSDTSRGDLEWYYHGKDLMPLCEAIHPMLNYVQQQIVQSWIDADGRKE